MCPLAVWEGFKELQDFGIEVPGVPLRGGVIQRVLVRDWWCGLGLPSRKIPLYWDADWGCCLTVPGSRNRLGAMGWFMMFCFSSFRLPLSLQFVIGRVERLWAPVSASGPGSLSPIVFRFPLFCF